MPSAQKFLAVRTTVVASGAANFAMIGASRRGLSTGVAAPVRAMAPIPDPRRGRRRIWTCRPAPAGTGGSSRRWREPRSGVFALSVVRAAWMRGPVRPGVVHRVARAACCAGTQGQEDAHETQGTNVECVAAGRGDRRRRRAGGVGLLPSDRGSISAIQIGRRLCGRANPSSARPCFPSMMVSSWKRSVTLSSTPPVEMWSQSW